MWFKVGEIFFLPLAAKMELAAFFFGRLQVWAESFHSSKLRITARGVAASRPPSTGMITPEIQRDSSLAK